jgi:hypothetical protein
MAKKCIPGIICFENITLLAIVIACIIFAIFYFNNSSGPGSGSTINNEITIQKDENGNNGYGYGNGNSSFFTRPNYGYTNLPNDVLMNPYEPPLKDERYLVGGVTSVIPPNSMPINVQTNIGAVDTTFRQVGILTPVKRLNDKLNDGQVKILALMGKPVLTTRDKWQYYTMTKHNIKLPIIRNGKNASNEYGVDIIYEGDKVHVEGYDESFKATIYEKNVIRYLPLI